MLQASYQMLNQQQKNNTGKPKPLKRNPTNSRQNDHKKNDSCIIHIGLGNKQNKCTNHEFKNKICKNFIMIGRNPARTIRPGPTPTSASSLRCRCCRSTFLNPTNDLSHFAEMSITPPLQPPQLQ